MRNNDEQPLLVIYVSGWWRKPDHFPSIRQGVIHTNMSNIGFFTFHTASSSSSFPPGQMLAESGVKQSELQSIREFQQHQTQHA